VGRSNFAQILTFEFVLVACEPEIANFDSPILGDQDVLGFQVTVKYFLFVEVGHGSCNLFGNSENAFFIKWDLLLVEDIEKASSGNEPRKE